MNITTLIEKAGVEPHPDFYVDMYTTESVSKIVQAALEEAAMWFEDQAYRETSWSSSRASAELMDMAKQIGNNDE